MPDPFSIRNQVTNTPLATFDGNGDLYLGGQATAGGRPSLDGTQVLPGTPLLTGALLCPPAQYAPAARDNPNTASATLAAVESNNINTGTFTAPASGQVLVTVSLTAAIGTGTGRVAFALAAHGTASPVLGNAVAPALTPNVTQFAMQFLVPGLTAGEPCNLDLLYASIDGAILTVYALGTTSAMPSQSGAPVIMTVMGA